jgi:hypothetical protein
MDNCMFQFLLAKELAWIDLNRCIFIIDVFSQPPLAQFKLKSSNIS